MLFQKIKNFVIYNNHPIFTNIRNDWSVAISYFTSLASDCTSSSVFGVTDSAFFGMALDVEQHDFIEKQIQEDVIKILHVSNSTKSPLNTHRSYFSYDVIHF